MTTPEPRFLEVGQAVLHLDTSKPLREQGHKVFAEALASGSQLPVQLALVWSPSIGAKAEPHQELLAGMREAAQAEHPDLQGDLPPMLGCTSPWVVGGSPTEAHADCVVVTLLRARTEHLSVRLGVGEDAISAPAEAAALACARADISEASMARCDGFVLTILPGLKHGAKSGGDADSISPRDSGDADLVETILAMLGSTGTSTFSVFGGSSADRSGKRTSWQYAMFAPYRDSLVVAKVVTRLNFGMGISHGFTLGQQPIRVGFGEARNGVSRILTELDGQPAGRWLKEQDEQPVILGFADAHCVYGPQKLYVNSDDASQAVVNWPVSVNGAAHEVSVVRRQNVLRAVHETSRQVAIRGMLSRPRFALVVACAGRAAVLDEPRWPEHEIRQLRDQWGSETVVAGFYARGELCRTSGHADYAENYAFALLVMDDELYPTVRMRQRLAVLDDMRRRLEAAIAQARQAATPNDVADAVIGALEPGASAGAAGSAWPVQGGMLSLVQTMRVANNHQQKIKGYRATERWLDICDATLVSRVDDSHDILALVLVGGEPQFIPNSQTDPRVDAHRMHLARPDHSRIEGQIVLRLVNPRNQVPIGTLQVELPLGYAPMPIELQVLSDFARQISAALCQAHEQQERIARLRRLAALTLETDLALTLPSLAKEALDALAGSWCCLSVAGVTSGSTNGTPSEAIECLDKCDRLAAAAWAESHGSEYGHTLCPAWPAPILVQLMVGRADDSQQHKVAAMEYLLAQLVGVISTNLARQTASRIPSLSAEASCVLAHVQSLLRNHRNELDALAKRPVAGPEYYQTRCEQLCAATAPVNSLVQALAEAASPAKSVSRGKAKTVGISELVRATATQCRLPRDVKIDINVPDGLEAQTYERPLRAAIRHLVGAVGSVAQGSVSLAAGAEAGGHAITVTVSLGAHEVQEQTENAGEAARRALLILQANKAATEMDARIERPREHCYLLRIRSTTDEQPAPPSPAL